MESSRQSVERAPAVGEEAAVASMRAGAHDYVMKGKMSRLVPTVRRALRESEERRERRAGLFRVLVGFTGHGATM